MACGLALDVFIRPYANGFRSIVKFRVWRRGTNRRLPYISACLINPES